MDKRKKDSLHISLGVFIVGMVILLFATKIGSAITIGLLERMGGMDLGQYQIILESNILTYQIIGGILAFLGGLGFIFAWYLKQDKDEKGEV